MNKVYRKTRKLLLNPKAFFYDSKIFNSKIQHDNITPIKAISKIGGSKVLNNKNVDVYISDSFSNNSKLISHVTKIISGLAHLSIGNYRLKDNEILFSCGGEIILATLNHPIEKEVIIKGSLLVTNNEISEDNNDKLKIIENLIHKINVTHLKYINDFNMLYYYYSARQESTEQSLVKYALLAGVYDESVINRAIILLNENFNTLTQSDSILFFRKVYRVLGTDGRLEKIADHFAAAIKKNTYPVHFIMNLAAFFTESGAYEKALGMANFGFVE